MNNPSRRGSLKVYVAGYLASIYLTVAAYFLVVRHAFSAGTILFGIVGLALIQLLVQLLCFLHLGTETKPRWKLVILLFMIMVVAILVLGSLWIMANLNYRMSPGQITSYLHNQGGF